MTRDTCIRMLSISRKIFVQMVIWFVSYSIIYWILMPFAKRLTWHFYIESVAIVGRILILIIFIPSLIIALFARDDPQEFD
jgi:hypothetical protein